MLCRPVLTVAYNVFQLKTLLLLLCDSFLQQNTEKHKSFIVFCMPQKKLNIVASSQIGLLTVYRTKEALPYAVKGQTNTFVTIKIN